MTRINSDLRLDNVNLANISKLDFANFLPYVVKSIIKNPPLTKQDFTVGTYNAFGGKGTNEEHEQEAIKNFASQTDIVGFQEADPILVSLLMDTHDVYFGSQGNPLFYNKEKFDLIHAEDVEIHDENHFRKALKEDGKTIDEWTDQRRTTNFIVLRSKETGALILVNNSHMDHRSSRSHDLHFEKMRNKNEELKEKFDIDAVVEFGDYNSAYNTMDEWAQENSDRVIGREDRTDQSNTIDRIYAYGTEHKIEGKPMERLGRANDDDWFDHEMSKKELTVTVPEKTKKKNQDLETKTFPGVLFFKDSQYRSDITMVGFGSSDQYYNHKKWNDKTTSIKMSEGMELTIYENADFSGKEFIYTENIGNVGDDANDMASAYRWTYRRPE